MLTPFSSKARTLGSLALFAVYIVLVLIDNFPYRLLDSVWIVNASVTIVDNAYYPLLGLILLSLDHPDNLETLPSTSLLRRCRRLSNLAAAGFALLIPLLGFVSWRSESQLLSPRLERIEYTRQKLDQLRLRVAAVSSTQDLALLLQSAQGITLTPADRRRPITQLRTELLRRLDIARQQLPDTQKQRANWRWNALLRWIRLSLLSLVYSLTFASLSLRRRSDQSLLESVASSIRGRGVALADFFASRGAAAADRRAFRQEIRLSQQRALSREEQDARDRLLLEKLEAEEIAATADQPSHPSTPSAPGVAPASRHPDLDFFHQLSQQQQDHPESPPDEPGRP